MPPTSNANRTKDLFHSQFIKNAKASHSAGAIVNENVFSGQPHGFGAGNSTSNWIPLFDELLRYKISRGKNRIDICSIVFITVCSAAGVAVIIVVVCIVKKKKKTCVKTANDEIKEPLKNDGALESTHDDNDQAGNSDEKMKVKIICRINYVPVRL